MGEVDSNFEIQIIDPILIGNIFLDHRCVAGCLVVVLLRVAETEGSTVAS